MGHLLGIRIRNYKALRDVVLGKYEYDKEKDYLPALTCLIGPNGSGKSTVLDAFGFLADCLAENVEAACDKPHRGGFESLRTKGQTGPIEFDLYYREDKSSRPISYSLGVELKDDVPVVAWETLKQRRKGQKHGRPYPFVKLEHGEGTAWSGQSTAAGEGNESDSVKLDDPRKLGITTLGQLKQHPRILGLRAFIEGWYLSYFLPDAARTLPTAGAQKHLNRTGDNLANVVQYMERRQAEFNKVLSKIARRIPGIRTIKTTRSADGRLLVAFNEQGFKDPFYAANMSDGTLKMFAYLLLLEDPEPRPFIGIEEPENGLYHRLLPRLAEEFKGHAASRDTNVLVTTHSPYLVDALSPEQVWLAQRDDRGHAELTRAADIKGVRELVDEGLALGGLWYSNHFHDRVSP
ncbi:MAG TPA: ATPase [Myxococcales bacterium]|jgi:predicted ATPase|nr:ATPase [Myxococcales bacterium]